MNTILIVIILILSLGGARCRLAGLSWRRAPARWASGLPQLADL